MTVTVSKQPTCLPAYLPTIDGWRGVSIALVILHHQQIHSKFPIVGELLRWLSDVGELGVELFFAISGLLICSRLLEEEACTGTIGARDFYLRRTFRILPAALFYLAIVAVLAAFRLIPLSATDWFASLFFFRNYAMLAAYFHHSPLAQHWYTGHFWSLSMEEHFYLLLPVILIILKKNRAWVLGGMAISIAIWRFALAHLMQHDEQFVIRTDTHLDALLIPASIACFLYPLRRRQAARRFLPVWSLPVLMGMEVGLLAFRLPFFLTLQAVILPLLVLSTVLNPDAFPAKVLELRPLRWIGWASYSLYLWQQLFFGSNLAGDPPQIAMLRHAPLNWLALAACAICSYQFVEKPFIRLGHATLQALAARRAVGAPRKKPVVHEPAGAAPWLPERTQNALVARAANGH